MVLPTSLAGRPWATVRSQARLYTIDRTPPDVTLNQTAGQADPTNTSPINFRVIFTEPVTNFATGDVTLSGTAGATTAIVTGSGTTYDVAVSGMTTDGTVVASVVAGVATDSAGNSNSASSSTDNTVTYDITPPAVTINQAAGQSDPTNASPINFTVKFTKPVPTSRPGRHARRNGWRDDGGGHWQWRHLQRRGQRDDKRWDRDCLGGG